MALCEDERSAHLRQFALERRDALYELRRCARSDPEVFKDGRYTFFLSKPKSFHSPAELHELLAKAYAAQGKLALQHISLAEYYRLSGGKQAALDQLGIARKAADASFYDNALIDARERELKELRREELKEAKK